MTRFSPTRPPTSDQAVHDTAVTWWLRASEGKLSTGERVRLQQWLDADPAHASAYQRVRRASAAVERHAAAPELMALRSAALAARAETPRRTSRLWGLTAAALVAVVGWSLLQPWVDPAAQPPRAQAQLAAARAAYRTGIGERAAITLPDGSTATLDTGSELQMDYTPQRRSVHLLRGQALFEVVKDPQRPFQVQAADRRVVAVGTVFNVRVEGDRVRVALLEGVVRVESPPARSARASGRAPQQQVVMAAGEILEMDEAGPMSVRTADTQRVARWRDGVVVFDDTRLVEAVAEMNRYTRTPIVLGDPSLHDYRVSGVFKTGDPQRFSASMAEVFPIDVARAADGAPLLRPRRQ